MSEKKRLIIIIVIGVLLILGAYIFMEWLKWQVEMSWMRDYTGIPSPR